MKMGNTGKTATIKLACEKILLFVVGIVLIGCATVPKASSPDFEAIRRIAGQIDYYDHLEPDTKDYYDDGNQFQGQCGDYSLMYSLETGAYLVIVNNNIPNGIYKVSSKDPAGSVFLGQWYSRISNRRTQSGELESGYYHIRDDYGERYGLYHPNIGAYVITFVTNNPDVEYLARRINTNHVFNAHPNGSGVWIYVDVTSYDTQNNWNIWNTRN